MLKKQFFKAPLIAVCGLLVLLVMAPAAQAAGPAVDPVLVQGNPECPEGTFVTKFDSPVAAGTTIKDGITLIRSGDHFEWSSTVPIDSVIAKGGPNANVYTYPYDTFGDDGLHAPMNGDVPFGLSHVEFCSDGDDEPEPNPAIALDKTGAATAAAGSTFTYSFKATNTGNVTLTNVELTDPKCQATVTRVEPNLADATFDPGDEWHYTCTVVAPAGPAQVDNVAEVCGDYAEGEGAPETVCDDDPHTFTVPPPDDPPAEKPPVKTPPTVTPNVVPPTTTPPTTTPDGGVLPETIVSGRAQLRGPSGCLKQAFKARVSGRSIRSVTFFVDGRKVKKIGAGKAFALKLNPKKYGLGRHKIVAKVRFTAESGTKARRLSLTFRRCAQGAVAPRFTG